MKLLAYNVQVAHVFVHTVYYCIFYRYSLSVKTYPNLYVYDI